MRLCQRLTSRLSWSQRNLKRQQHDGLYSNGEGGMSLQNYCAHFVGVNRGCGLECAQEAGGRATAFNRFSTGSGSEIGPFLDVLAIS